MKNVVKDELKEKLKKEEVINEKIEECYYSICRYYNKDIKIIEEYKKYGFYNWQLRI